MVVGRNQRTSRRQLKGQANAREGIKDWSYKDYVDKQFVISGGPSSAVEQLENLIDSLHVGNLMVLMQIGSMPHELTMKNIDLFTNDVLPHIQDRWSDKYENNWWPERLRTKQPSSELTAVGGAE